MPSTEYEVKTLPTLEEIEHEAVNNIKHQGSLVSIAESGVINLMTLSFLRNSPQVDKRANEAKANIMLAYRHLQDAESRLDLAARALLSAGG
jgi:hypothetical protein